MKIKDYIKINGEVPKPGTKAYMFTIGGYKKINIIKCSSHGKKIDFSLEDKNDIIFNIKYNNVDFVEFDCEKIERMNKIHDYNRRIINSLKHLDIVVQTTLTENNVYDQDISNCLVNIEIALNLVKDQIKDYQQNIK